ncbi:MAG: DNA-directed RNA polymerase subunit M [Clostridiales bacterium]|uniref:DNA-directed RNA polymerase subunit M n=1 Tax=Roseburia sp. MSJ-14 TaxID=2841514 RepID=UPI001693713B|nr:DNA-directed RNA polymerase subunit M [Roseburia sp. MSJ-14]MBU5474258.1 DNA-directed RNA polymerase subunit M [Roseburia sp. MSJ-14]NLK78587.1 DNA-directed RNA polymerase subunit M [Clostridiales bacterium]
MMKVFICPGCGSMTTVSRRKEVTCYKCEGIKMVPSKLSFAQYSEMDEQQRQDYAQSWLYIRERNKK